MDPSGYIYAAIVAIAYVLVARRSPAKAKAAGLAGGKQLLSILPTFVAVFGLVGLFEIFVPPSMIERFMGDSAPLQSLFVGASVGSVAAGPPPAAFPIAASLIKGGAWLPGVAAFIVSWVLVGIASLPFEARLFGTRFAVLRNALSFVAAMGIGLAMGWIL